MATTETPWLNELSHCGGHFCPFLEVTAKLTLEINGTVVGQASYTLRYLRISADATGKLSGNTWPWILLYYVWLQLARTLGQARAHIDPNNVFLLILQDLTSFSHSPTFLVTAQYRAGEQHSPLPDMPSLATAS
ncbi:unnamed protein product [Leuciscus chuanchicus]